MTRRTPAELLSGHHRARHTINAAGRMWDKAQTKLLEGDGDPFPIENLAGFVIVNTRPTGVTRPRWAAYVAYIALTGRRPPRWLIPAPTATTD